MTRRPESTPALLAAVGAAVAWPVVAGVALGIVSRFVDTAAWAPVWIGSVLTPWLAAAWMAGSRAWNRVAGALLGTALLGATVVAYLVSAAVGSGGPEAARLAPGLVALSLVAGPLWGNAGAAAQAADPRAWVPRLAGASMLGAAFVAEGALLQLGERGALERILFGAEVLAGLALAVRISGNLRAGPLTLTTGACLLALELAVFAVLGIPLA